MSGNRWPWPPLFYKSQRRKPGPSRHVTCFAGGCAITAHFGPTRTLSTPGHGVVGVRGRPLLRITGNIGGLCAVGGGVGGRLGL